MSLKEYKKKWSIDFDARVYKIMAENFGEEIFVTDGKGIAQYLNPAAAKIIGLPIDKIIGRSVSEMVKEGLFKPSVSLEVIKHKKEVSILQTLTDGSVVLGTGVPIFDRHHERIEMVICTSKNVAALNDLLDKIETQKHQLEKNKEEISNLRDLTFEEANLIGVDENTQELKETLLRVAPLDMTVLIQGETGVGKEVVARAIHKFSGRKNKPFVKINCGTIPENLIESELFGYEKGAFTGAEKSGKRGKVELAQDGTLFLDEIGEMPLSLQVKLLDFLQDGSFEAIGGNKRKKVKTRILTATNRDLMKMCQEGKFRKDLFYRINVIPITISPLRDRPKDIEALTKYFLSQCNAKYGENKRLSKKLSILMSEYNWPGNVRELENFIEYVYITSNENEIEEDVGKVMLKDELNNSGNCNLVCKGIMPLKEAKKEVEKQLVNRAYELHGSTYKAAHALGIDQSTVVKIMKKHNS